MLSDSWCVSALLFIISYSGSTSSSTGKLHRAVSCLSPQPTFPPVAS